MEGIWAPIWGVNWGPFAPKWLIKIPNYLHHCPLVPLHAEPPLQLLAAHLLVPLLSFSSNLVCPCLELLVTDGTLVQPLLLRSVTQEMFLDSLMEGQHLPTALKTGNSQLLVVCPAHLNTETK